ncbi:MAG TPA: MMPL family transporter [Candidatus Binataceae bacterium]|nr:MMPL family transporter [Candidatus Binataceae bacterium]
MDDEHSHRTLALGRYIIEHRLPIGLILIIITAFMGYWAAKVKIATRFEDFFPAQHGNTLLYRKYERHYGSAQTLLLMLRVKKGDIFNSETLQKIQDITREVNILPGIDHNEVFSLASYRVGFATALPGAIVTSTFMYPDVPTTAKRLETLRHNVDMHREVIAGLLTDDNRGALVTATFGTDDLNYKTLFDDIQKIVHKYSDANTEIFVAGQPIVSGWGYSYLPRITSIFVASIVLMLIILYLSLGHRSSWWAPMLTGSFSAIWGLGFVSLMGYNFDPVMMVIPFILTARDLSHGIQWQGRYYNELDRLDEKLLACATTTDVMLPPGLLAIFADIAGIIFISLGGIPVLKEIGLGGAVWLAGSLTMVFVFQPIFMSYLPRPHLRERRWWRKRWSGDRGGTLASVIDWLVRVPVTPGTLRTAILLGGGAFILFGVVSGQRAHIGYETIGTPLYKPDSKVNQDIAEIAKFFPTDEGWIVLTTPDYPDQQSGISPNVLRMTDDMGAYLVSRGDADALLSFSGIAIGPLDEIFHNGFPKYRSMPSSQAPSSFDKNMTTGVELGGNLWYMFLAGTAPGEMERFYAFAPHVTSACIRVLLPDHTYSRLNRLRDDIRTFVAERVTPDPDLTKVKVEYLGGLAGLFLAANDVLKDLDFINITFVLLVIYLCCAFVFRSLVAGLLFILSCIMANFGAFIYMNARHIGLTIDTIPVISLGIGLGVDYGIYTVARIRDEVVRGATVEDAVSTALRTTGAAVFSTFAVMIGGILPWAFSPLLFHNEMSLLLIFLMATNMIAGVWILPAYIAWQRPKFITRYLSGDVGQVTSAAITS